METTHQGSQTNPIYQEKLTYLLTENRRFFIIGLIASVIVGYFFVLYIVSPLMTRMRKGTYTLLNQTTRIKKTHTLTEPINVSIDYISPHVTNQNTGIKGSEGQISAIVSDQVTYTKNVYTVQKGESLGTVAKRVYGDQNAWVKIATANNLKSPNHIEVGMELKIPR